MINNAIIKYMESACMPNLTRLEMSVTKCTNQQRKKHNQLTENDMTAEKRWQRNITTYQRQITFKKEGLLYVNIKNTITSTSLYNIKPDCQNLQLVNVRLSTLDI